MKSLLFATILVLPTFQLAGDAAEQMPVEKIADKVRPSLLTVIHAGREGHAQGLGTGFVISKDGLVVTNFHVVGEARPIQVELQDGRRPKVTEVIGWSRKDDLIIFRMDVTDVPPLPMGPGEKMTQGTAVVAMGNPLGLRYSVVNGVVSEVRTVGDQELIQLAMPIERGNSGGPLVDVDGKLRGIINMKSAVTENLGYAIPVATLQGMLSKPVSIKMENWLTIGKLNPKLWKSPHSGWTQRAGLILAQRQGEGFGGRTVCLHQVGPPERPYEISVKVKYDDASGAAGLAFCADGTDTHYGFYPTAGKLRLTRFEGPDVAHWTILKEVTSEHLRPGEWNHLRVRVEKTKILCYLNGHEVITNSDTRLRTGNAGLCKFRQTEPQFKNFQLAKSLDPQLNAKETEPLKNIIRSISSDNAAPATAVEGLSKNPAAARELIDAEIIQLQTRVKELERLTLRVHEADVIKAMKTLVDTPDDAQINLAEAALLIAKLDNPDVVVADYLAVLEHLAQEFRGTLSKDQKFDPLQTTQRLAKWLFDENGFHGSRDDYYSKSNSYLNEVIDDREGLPITLAVVFLELAWKLELPVAGIPLPGHFVVQFRPKASPDDGPYFDVFDRGKQLKRSEALELSSLPENAAPPPPSTKRQILVRILRNLIGPQLREKSESALPYLNLLLTISPQEPDEHISRSIIYFQLGEQELARADVEWLLKNRPPGLDLERLQQWLDKLPATK